MHDAADHATMVGRAKRVILLNNIVIVTEAWREVLLWGPGRDLDYNPSKGQVQNP